MPHPASAILVRTALLLAAALAAGAAAERGGASVNMLDDPSFEAPAAGGGLPPAWTVVHPAVVAGKPPPALARVVDDPGQAHSGRACLRLGDPGATTLVLRSGSERIGLPTGLYEVSAWVRGKPGTIGYIGVAGLQLGNTLLVDSERWRRVSWTCYSSGGEFSDFDRAVAIHLYGTERQQVPDPLMFVDDVALVRLESGLADVFGDHMVLQRGKPLPIWGWARNPGQQVTVRLHGVERTATADAQGRWRVDLAAMPAGGPYRIEVDGYTAADDIMIGDVWVCAGQSNMEFGIDKLNGEFGHAPEAIAAADDPRLRLFAASQQAALQPMRAYVVRQDVGTMLKTWQAKWRPCTPGDIAQGWWGGFSAIGYLFGRAIADDQKVTIGLIQLAHGGTSIEAWSSADGLAGIPRAQWVVPPLAETLAAHPAYLPWPGIPDVPGSPAYREAVQPRLNRALAAQLDEKAFNQATACFNGQVAPIFPMAVAGVLWYQGEHNGGDVHYGAKLAALIADWRGRFGQGEVPFLIAQLCNWQAPDPGFRFQEAREGQLQVARTVPGTALAVTIDLADPPGTGRGPADIHPRNKQEVARRLALAARRVAYHEPVAASGPLYRGMRVDGGRILLDFDPPGVGLAAAGGKPTGFLIAGEDRRFVPAEAEIAGSQVAVHAAGVPHPVAVRYGFACFVDPLGTLQSPEGLPASPFRTDDWPEPAKP